MARINAENINDNILKEFKNYVINKHGKLKGAYSIELEKAIVLYLEVSHGVVKVENKRTHTINPIEPAEPEPSPEHTPIPSPQGPSMYGKKVNNIMMQLKSMGSWDIPDFPGDLVVKLIRSNIGVSKRTIKDYLPLVFEAWSSEHTTPSIKAPVQSIEAPHKPVEAHIEVDSSVNIAISNLKATGKWNADNFPAGEVMQQINNDFRMYSKLESIWKQEHHRF